MPHQPALEISNALAAFVAEAPVVREAHVRFLHSAAASLPAGSRILDVGAGDAPYRELFDGHTYITSDWSESFYRPEQAPDIVAPAHDIPLPDSDLDAIVCTQVLEHVPEPRQVLQEFARALKPGGRVWITTPFVWYLHELPHDYYRYTSYGLAHLLQTSGFADIDCQPMNDSPHTMSQLLRHLGWLLGTAEDGRDERRVMAGDLAAKLSHVLEEIGYLDTQWLLPVSFSATARMPDIPR